MRNNEAAHLGLRWCLRNLKEWLGQQADGQASSRQGVGPARVPGAWVPQGLHPADGSRPWGVKRASFGSASPGDTQWRRGPECRAAPSKPAGREAGALTPGLFLATPWARQSASPPPVGLSNGRSQRGAGLPGLRAESTFLSIRGALGVRTAHGPSPLTHPNLRPWGALAEPRAAAPQQAGTASPRLRLLRDTGRSAAGCRAPDGRGYERERPGRWGCSPGRHGAEPFRSPQVSPRTRAEPPQVPSGQTRSSCPQFFQSLTLLLK